MRWAEIRIHELPVPGALMARVSLPATFVLPPSPRFPSTLQPTRIPTLYTPDYDLTADLSLMYL